MDRETILELVSKVTELNDISEHMSDEDLDTALAYVVKLVANPDVPIFKVPALIVKLQAIAALCQIKAKHYQIYGGGVDAQSKKLASEKKNMYYTVSAEIDKLVAALKYYSK